MGSMDRWLLFIFLFAVVLPLLGSNLWGYWRTRSYALAAAQREVRHVAAHEAAETRGFVREASRIVLSIISGNQHLIQTTRALLTNGNLRDLQPYRQALHIHLGAKARKQGSVREFSIVSASGRLLASSDANRRFGEDWRETMCHRGRTEEEVSVVGFEYPDGEPVLVLSAPVRLGLAVPTVTFCARLDFNIHHRLVDSAGDRFLGTLVLLLDQQRQIACGSYHGAGTGHGAQDHGHDGRDSRAHASEKAYTRLQLATGSEAASGRYHNERGGEVLAAWHPVGVVDWGVLVEIPVASALADLERLKWQAILGSTALVAAVVLTVLFFARALSGSLQTLSVAARRIADGDLSEQVPEIGFTELAQLAASFNEMSAALRDSHELLEERIRERTSALERSLRLTDLVLDSVDHHVIVIDRQMRIIRANPAARVAHGHELVGEIFARICEGSASHVEVPGTGGCVDCAVSRTLQTGEPDAAERAVQTAGGPQIIALQTWPVKGPDGRVELVIEIGRQVTQERRLQAQMMHQEKMAAFGLLAAGMAHEIGNPLAAIESQLRLAASDQRADRVAQTIDVVREQVQRMGRLLRELVDFSRRKRDEVIRVSVPRVAEDVVRLLGHDPRARNVQLTEELPILEVSPVRLMEDHLVQVLLNLGMNALDAMPAGGDLTFRIAEGPGQIALRIIDTGGGIPVQAASRVFEPFFTTKAVGRGTGLGLFVSRSVVEGFGGGLTLEGSGPDGTTFILTIPVRSDDAVGAPAAVEAT